MIGETIGRYSFKSRLGGGGMGEVYCATDLALQRDVAIKVLSAKVTQDAVQLQRFKSEAVVLAQLGHPNIANVYDFFEQGGQHMLVMELIEGETFEHYIHRVGPLPPGLAAHMVAQALDGLSHAHARGIIHRDIKPANLMLTRAGNVKLMDFGIARAEGTRGLTQEGKIIGTPEYMSPEQIRPTRELDARSDLYSFGIVLFELLTGKAPFSATSDFEVMRCHIEEKPKSVRELNGKIPGGLEKIVARALAKKPEDRFQTAQDFRAALLPFANANAAMPTQAKRSSSDTVAEMDAYTHTPPHSPAPVAKKKTTSPRAIPTTTGKKSPMLAIAAIGGLAVIAIAAYLMTQGGQGNGNPSPGPAPATTTGGTNTGGTDTSGSNGGETKPSTTSDTTGGTPEQTTTTAGGDTGGSETTTTGGSGGPVVSSNVETYEELRKKGVAAYGRYIKASSRTDKQKALEESISAFRTAADLQPDDAMAWANLGVSLFSAGNTYEAEDAYNRARVIDPDHPGVKALSRMLKK